MKSSGGQQSGLTPAANGQRTWRERDEGEILHVEKKKRVMKIESEKKRHEKREREMEVRSEKERDMKRVRERCGTRKRKG